MLVDMRGESGRPVTVGDWADKLMGSARRNHCLSAREVRQRSAEARAMALALSVVEHQAVLDQLPPNYVEGLVALDKQSQSEKARLAGNHRQRIKMLDRVEDLPWCEHWDLLRRAARAAGPTGISANPDISWHRDTPAAERAVIRAEVATMTRLLIVLFLLSLAGRHKYPGALLLMLLWALGVPSIVPSPIAPPSAGVSPMRVLWPPGRQVLAGPRVARAPGMACPSLSIAAGATPGWARSGGTP